MPQPDRPCPCGVDTPYSEHCGKVHRCGAGLGVSAESLMRARYSAYLLEDRQFLVDSWHLDTRPEALDFDNDIEWLGLEIIETVAGSGLDTTGTVEFKARFRRGEEHLELHERSSFLRVNGTWLYVSGA